MTDEQKKVLFGQTARTGQ